jgi:hypothetical protein
MNRALLQRESAMTAFNAVRFKVKPGRDQERPFRHAGGMPAVRPLSTPTPR